MADTYTVPMINQTIVADATLVIIHADSTATSRGCLLECHRFHVSQQAEETGQQLGVLIGWKASAFGTYTSTTPVPTVGGPSGVVSAIVGGTTGAEGTAGTDASAEGAGTVTTILEEGYDNRNGFTYIPTETERPLVFPDTAIILKIVGTPSTLTAWNAYITFREVH